MQKEKIVVEDYPIGSVVSVFEHQEISFLEGKLLTILDAAFTNESQANAVKSLLRESLWKWAHNCAIHEKALIGKDLNPHH